MGRRGNGEGSIYQRKSDGKWVCSITLENGKRKVLYGNTRKEVQEKLKVVLREQQQGKVVVAPQQTVKQFLDDWLENTHKQNVRPRSYERYEELIRLHIVPSLGKVQLQKLTPQHLRKLYAEKLKEGLSPKTVTSIHNLLHTALDAAMKWDLVGQNVTEKVSPPRKVQHEIKPLSPEQVHRLLDEAQGHSLEALLILALSTGMRRGELLGLKWQDIDFINGTLQVRRILNRVPTKMVKETGQSFVEAEPKTDKSRRQIVLATFAIEALKQHRAHQAEMKKEAGTDWQEHDYVFSNAIGNYLHPGNNVLVPFKRLLQKAGLPDVRFHDLRHSAATMLLSKGVHPKIVQELLGHSEIGMTLNIYSHVLPTMQRDAISMLNATLTNREDDEKGR